MIKFRFLMFKKFIFLKFVYLKFSMEYYIGVYVYIIY